MSKEIGIVESLDDVIWNKSLEGAAAECSGTIINLMLLGRTIKIGFLLVAVVFAGEIALYLHPPLYILGLATLGHSPFCSELEAYKGAKEFSSVGKFLGRISKQVHFIKQDSAGYTLWQTPRGTFWIPKGSDAVLPILIAQQESKIYGMDDNTMVQPGSVVLDCGAHIGVYVKEALSKGAKQVVAIEPAPENIECLRRNFAKEIAENQVTVYPKGVWDKEETLTLHVNPNNSAGDSFVIKGQDSQEVNQVHLTTIDKLVDELKLDRIDFIKMDIEGATDRALTGAKQTLLKYKPRLAISTEEDNDDPGRIINIIDDFHLGYRRQCGQCALRGYSVFPEVLFFY